MQLIDLYREFTGVSPVSVKALTPAGSSRRYYRLEGPVSLVGVVGTDVRENETFFYLTRHFMSCGLPVPELLTVSRDNMEYLLSDLGDVSLFSRKDNIPLLEKTMRTLARFHRLGSIGVDYKRCFPVEAFDRTSVMWDLNYFKYSFLNTCAIPYSEPRLEKDFVRLASEVASHTDAEGVLMLRDFQSRNVMIKDDEPYFIDYQGARRGPAAYDLASFLWQAKAAFPAKLKRALIDVYASEAGLDESETRALHKRVKEMALVRTLQVLGAYGLRGRFEKKAHFLQSIPFALGNLDEIISDGGADAFPYLKELAVRLIEGSEGMTADEPFDGLTVCVTSFSYKRGIPDDMSGNGGGFVFDCRAMDNPGRYEQYKRLTGLDSEVIDFLEQRGEIQVFLKSCYDLVRAAVENYLSRGFTSLSVCFGCTGGQHRSVYSAQHMAEYIKRKFPQVRVILNHREQKIRSTL